jgi:uncharacterized protein (TIGR03086 family)
MNQEAATASLTGGIGLLERAMSYTLGSLQLVSADALAAPSPCHGWDLRDLLAHMNDSLKAMHEAGDVGQVALSAAANYGDPDTNPVSTLRNRACSMLGAWANHDDREWVTVDGCPVTGSIVTATGALEIAVHGWDVARTLGQGRPLPRLLAEELLPLAGLLVTEADRPSRFAAAVPTSPTAAPDVRLLAFLGRHP